MLWITGAEIAGISGDQRCPFERNISPIPAHSRFHDRKAWRITEQINPLLNTVFAQGLKKQGGKIDHSYQGRSILELIC